jgi:sulfur relay (sulfurtransferase) DsrC/TusE family protein
MNEETVERIREVIDGYLDDLEDWDQLDTQDLAENIVLRLEAK